MIQCLEDLVPGSLVKGLSVAKIPGLGLEAVETVVAAPGYKQRYPDTFAIGDVIGFDFSVIHVLIITDRRQSADIICTIPAGHPHSKED